MTDKRDHKLEDLTQEEIGRIMELNSKDFLWMMGLLLSGEEPADGITEYVHDYTETIDGKEYKLRLNVYCDNALLFIHGVTGVAVDVTCQGCLMNFYQMVNDLMRDDVVYYGKVTLGKSGYIDYTFCHYIPAGLDLEKLSESWEELGKVAITSVKKDIHRLLHSILELSKKTAHESHKRSFKGKGSQHVH